MEAQLVDIFQSQIGERSVILAAGRLHNGESFALVDDRLSPLLFLRVSDRTNAESALRKYSAQHRPTDWTTLDGERVDAWAVATSASLKKLDQDLKGVGIRTYEADLDFAIRYRIERQISSQVEIQGEWRKSESVDRLYINPELKPSDKAVDLRVLVLDIETDATASEIFGFSFVAWTLSGRPLSEEVHLRGSDESGPDAVFHPDERSLLEAFRNRLRELDPDIISGWNVIDFDLAVIARLFAKYRLTFNLGRSKDRSYLRENKGFARSKVVIHGRQVVDAMQLVRFSLTSFEDLRLDTVARELLGRGKTLAIEEWEDAPERIATAFRQDKRAFCEYVLEDSRLVRDILQSERLLEMALARIALTRMPLDRAWSSVVAFETLYIGEMHKRGLVAPSWGVDSEERWGNSGGLVLNPKAGLHEHVLVFDFKSLYPSIMRTFNIDPLSYALGKAERDESRLIRAPNGAAFDRSPAILPSILDRFFANREAAKKSGQGMASYAYKILMNSFYGVLATDSCRFADSAIADAITGFGQQFLAWMRNHFENLGFSVLYGDTDSLFVQVSSLAGLSLAERLQEGRRLCAEANAALAASIAQDYALTSHMELEFEKYYRSFFLPSMRQGEAGRAKNYAGLRQDEATEDLEITGMEAVRSDWTRLARDLQKDLLRQLFRKEDPERMLETVKTRIHKLLAGELDADLIYRKRIRKPLSAYTKTTPPHIKAARLLPKTVRVIRYVMTENGPEPVGFQQAPLDYGFYIEKQIRPIVEGLAPFASFSAKDACDIPDEEAHDLVLGAPGTKKRNVPRN